MPESKHTIRAQTYDVLRIFEELSCGETGDFVDDDMREYLVRGYITEEAARDDAWQKLPVQFGAPERLPMLHAPTGCVLYYDEAQRPTPMWAFSFVHVTLPEGWSLRAGCECGTQIDPSSFVVVEGDQPRATISNCPQQRIQRGNPLSTMLQVVDAVAQQIENQDASS